MRAADTRRHRVGSNSSARKTFLLTLALYIAAGDPSPRAAASPPRPLPPCCFVAKESVPSPTLIERRHHSGERPLRRRRRCAEICDYKPVVALVPPALRHPFARGTALPSSPSLDLLVAEPVAEPPSEEGRRRSGPKARRSGRPAASAAASVLRDGARARDRLGRAAAYTDVGALRAAFGGNRNRIWGDFDPETARRLYHALLPRALVTLCDLGVMTETELAPLAFEARRAVKKYVRERCALPGRVLAILYEGFRSLRRYGQWSSEGPTWEQLWDKYERQIRGELQGGRAYNEDELKRLICRRILERSCQTNPTIDRIFHCGSLFSRINRRAGKKRKTNVRKKRQNEVVSIAAKVDKDFQELLFEVAKKSLFFQPILCGVPTIQENERRDDGRTLEVVPYNFAMQLLNTSCLL